VLLLMQFCDMLGTEEAFNKIQCASVPNAPVKLIWAWERANGMKPDTVIVSQRSPSESGNRIRR